MVISSKTNENITGGGEEVKFEFEAEGENVNFGKNADEPFLRAFAIRHYLENATVKKTITFKVPIGVYQVGDTIKIDAPEFGVINELFKITNLRYEIAHNSATVQIEAVRFNRKK